MSVFNNKKKLKQSTVQTTSSISELIKTTTVTDTGLDNKYINSSGDSMNGVLAINPYIKFPDDSEQSTAYTNEKNVIL